MKKEFVPYIESLALKELGFDEECLGWYDYLRSLTEYKIKNSILDNLNTIKECCSAPLYRQAFRWFREIKRIDGLIDFDNDPEDEDYDYKYGYEIRDFNTKKVIYNKGWLENELWGSYEEAELACLRKLIEIVKNKQL